MINLNFNEAIQNQKFRDHILNTEMDQLVIEYNIPTFQIDLLRLKAMILNSKDKYT